jgi:hypothetical protein
LIEALYGARLDAPLSPATAASVQIAASTGELCFLCGRAEHEESGSAREAAVWGSLCGPGGCAFLVGFVRDTKRFPRIAEGQNQNQNQNVLTCTSGAVTTTSTRPHPFLGGEQ